MEEGTRLLGAADVETQRPKKCGVFQTSRVFLVLFFMCTLCVLGVGAVLGVSNYVTHTEVDGTGQGRSISDYRPVTPSSFGLYRFAAVATDAAECSTVGTEVLGDGGSAVDAAIASMLCVGLLNPHSAGIGGGSFMLIYDTPPGESQRRVRALDFRETAPSFATTEFYGSDRTKLEEGKYSISVPGEIRGYYEAWQQYGRLPWRRLLQPVIRMCRQGYNLRPVVADALVDEWDTMNDDPSWRELFLNEDGQLYQENEVMTNHRLADTYEAIASDPDTFYTGDLAEKILEDLAEAGSLITAEDLRSYKPIWREPARTYLKSTGLTSYTMPPPSSGSIYHFMLRLMESYDFNPLDVRYEHSAILTYHRIAEILKFGFAEKTYLGDPGFSNLTKYLDRWNSDSYLDYIRGRVDDDQTHDIPYYEPSAIVQLDSGTCHLSILAPDGTAVAATTSINNKFGSKIRGNNTGIIFNDGMDDFDVPGPWNSSDTHPSSANFVEPGKRPSSSMIPTIMLDEDTGLVRLVIGGSGGKRILSSTTYITAHHLWLGDRIDQAIDTPRLHHTLSPNILQYESSFPEDILRGLADKGHELESSKSSTSVCQAIRSYCEPCHTNAICRKTCIQAVSDWRKEGKPDGF